MSKALGVKEAMKHYVSTFKNVEEPATTIKGLTKQIVKFTSLVQDDSIANARTIADIYEAAAIANGYEPPIEDIRTVLYSFNLTDSDRVTQSSLPNGVVKLITNLSGNEGRVNELKNGTYNLRSFMGGSVGTFFIEKGNDGSSDYIALDVESFTDVENLPYLTAYLCISHYDNVPEGVGLNDGEFEVCIMNGKNILDILKFNFDSEQ